jgi:predicted metal-dependent phosphoesterase TrpH
MTPANIAGMAMLNGLNIIALTDHNSARNCPAFFHHAKKYGLVPIPGMELTTAEDIHVVCLFRSLCDALSFDEFVSKRRPDYKNKPDIFGHQYLMDENDEIIGEEDTLLINASDISIDEAFDEVSKRGGVCIPAHIDRTSNGIISVLGAFPPEPEFTSYELNKKDSQEEYIEKFPILSPLVHTVSSDAHRLCDIREADFSIELFDEPYSSEFVRNRLIDYLSGIKHTEETSDG